MKCFPNTKHILLIIDTSSEPKKCQNRQKNEFNDTSLVLH